VFYGSLDLSVKLFERAAREESDNNLSEEVDNKTNAEYELEEPGDETKR